MDCLDLGGGGDAPDLGYDAWYYQTCTEFVMPFCADGKQDMFLPSEFNFEDYKQNCIETFGTYPRKGIFHIIFEEPNSGESLFLIKKYDDAFCENHIRLA